MEPAAQPVDLSPIQEAIIVLRDLGIVGLLLLFTIGLMRGWWKLGVRVENGVPSDERGRELNKVVLSFPGARRRLRRRRR